MNNLLEVKVKYNREGRKLNTVYDNLRKNDETSVEKISILQKNLESVLLYYDNNPKMMDGFLIDANYNDIIAKSRRIREILKPKGRQINDTVVGARFSDGPIDEECHIITYYTDRETIVSTIEKLNEAKRFLKERLEGKATAENFNESKDKPSLDYSGYSSKHKIRKMIVDCSVVKSFTIPNVTAESYRDSLLLTFFQTEKSLYDILEELNVDSTKFRYSFCGKDSISASWDLYQMLSERVPYMISMISSDMSKVTLDDYKELDQYYNKSIPVPADEPIIGVIDNLFDESAYFSEWVENIDYLDEFEAVNKDVAERDHGTAVSSIIVDGPSLNPWLDDGCGRFRVRHFGVCEYSISVPKLMTKIKKIVDDNPDIHVWNLSLGTDDEVSRSFISYDAAVLDDIQARKNVIFVISGTNDNRTIKDGVLRVGSPADSLNAVVVNSVRRNNQPASYSRKGNILSFFNKPDVSYYGGDYEDAERINVCTSRSIEGVFGTSFAAPWISRKMAFLIDVIGLSREVAKALIIDAAAGWEYKQSTYKNRDRLGYGIVPIDIRDVLSSENQEIRFVLSGTAMSYKTSNYAIPVPKDKDDKYPYVARATLCYFPECDRSQGVDYTSRELSLKFGRVNNKGVINDINDNNQDDDGSYADERESRREFRKWENTKFISRVLKNNKPAISYSDRLWGVSVISKERLTTYMKSDINFGIVVTLRELYGINRIQDFITACTLRGWIVNEIDLEARLDLYNRNQEEIILE